MLKIIRKIIIKEKVKRTIVKKKTKILNGQNQSSFSPNIADGRTDRGTEILNYRL